MSGYRNLHREQLESCAIWNVTTSNLLLSSATSSSGSGGLGYRIWTASADGTVRSYLAKEKSLEDTANAAVLDASNLSMTLTHHFVGQSSSSSGEETKVADNEATTGMASLGCTRVCVARNYAGEDESAGDLIVASLEMTGIVRLWLLPENEDNQVATSDLSETMPNVLRPEQEFAVENATGTGMLLCPPRWTGPGMDVSVAVCCLDGTVAQVSTGILTPQRLVDASNSKDAKEATPAGTVLDRWGSRGSSIPMSIAWHPQAKGVCAVGRQNGQLDILTSSNTTDNNNQQKQRRHRLRFPGHDSENDAPIRAVTYTPDGALLSAGNDAGMLCIWDMSRAGAPPALVHHVVRAHSSWILDITALADSRRWASCGADRKIHVWKVDQMYQPVHTFDSDQTVWTTDVTTHGGSGGGAAPKTSVRLAAGTETGVLQVLSLDG